MMDPEATVAIVDLKADGGDFEPFAARADFYHAGMGPGTVEKVAAMLTEAAVRMDSPSRYGRKPLLILIDEAHEIAGHKAIGPLLERLVRSGRAAGIILVLSTQRTSKASIPADITTSMIHRVCLRVGDQPTNDLALGTGAYARGLDATKFTEPGQAWVIGFGSAPVQAKLVSNGADVIEPIAALPREPRPILGASSDPQPEQAPEQAWPIILGDLYDIWPVDHAQQIRQRNAFLDDLAARLAAQWPGRYDGMDRARLRTELRDCGVEPRLKVRVGPDQGPGLAIGDITPPSRNTGPTRTP